MSYPYSGLVDPVMHCITTRTFSSRTAWLASFVYFCFRMRNHLSRKMEQKKTYDKNDFLFPSASQSQINKRRKRSLGLVTIRYVKNGSCLKNFYIQESLVSSLPNLWELIFPVLLTFRNEPGCKVNSQLEHWSQVLKGRGGGENKSPDLSEKRSPVWRRAVFINPAPPVAERFCAQNW